MKEWDEGQVPLPPQDAEEAAKEELKKDSKISGKRGSFVSSWEVKHIENIPDV